MDICYGTYVAEGTGEILVNDGMEEVLVNIQLNLIFSSITSHSLTWVRNDVLILVCRKDWQLSRIY